MARKKNYKMALDSGFKACESANDDLRIDLPRNPRGHRHIDHSQYLGLGFDAWAIQSIFVIRVLLRGGGFSVSTLIGYSVNGLRLFVKFLCGATLESPPEMPSKLTRHHLECFVSWLKLKYPNGSTAKNYYTSFKSLVTALGGCGFIFRNVDEMLPPNAFPSNSRRTVNADPLSYGEMQRLLSALKSDLIAIHKGCFTGSNAEVMSVMLLIVAARSGINTTPLLEMARDALSPHPFVPNLRIINTVKRRGKGPQINVVRQKNWLINTVLFLWMASPC